MRILEPTLSRRDFVKVGGALVVSVSLPSTARAAAGADAGHTLDASKLGSWLELHADGTIIGRSGKTETGTSATAFYAQVIAEELDVEAAKVTMVVGHTDETPDGGFSAG